MKNISKNTKAILLIILFGNINILFGQNNIVNDKENGKINNNKSTVKYEIATWLHFKNAAVTFNFDDGSKNQFAIARPYLDKYGYKATFFIVNKQINSKFDGINWDTLRKVAKLGHEIGSHSYTHKYLNLEPRSVVEYEMIESKKSIEANIPKYKCLSFAYPGAIYNDTVIEIAKKYFISSRANGTFVNYFEPFNTANLYKLNSITFENYKVYQSLINNLINKKGWMINRIHGIDNNGYAPISIEFFKQMVDYVKANETKIWVAPQCNVVKYIKERDNTKVEVIENKSSFIILRIDDNLDDKIYDQPITIRLEIPKTHDFNKVYVNNHKIEPIVTEINNSIYITFDVVPSRAAIKIWGKGENDTEVNHNKKLQTAKQTSNTSDNTIIEEAKIVSYPNPFNNYVNIEYTIPQTCTDEITIEVMDINGNIVNTILKQKQQPGNYVIKYNTKELSQGLYLYIIKSKGFTISKKMYKIIQ